MPTHGKAREATISALRKLTPFARKGYSMSAVQGAVTHFGKMDAEDIEAYQYHARVNDVMYTVLSYATPIAWVLRNGMVVIPDTKYSVTTTNQQNLCKVYLAKS